MEHIETIELTSSQASITFSSIPQDYNDLVVLVSARSDDSSGFTLMFLKFNASTSNRSTLRLFGTGSSTGSASYSNGLVGIMNTGGTTANTFDSQSLYISNYKAAQAKSVSSDGVAENNATDSRQGIFAFLWDDTSAITSIELESDVSSNFVSGSTFSLYGITAGGDGTVTTS